MSYKVVEFVDSKEVAVISSAWMLDEENAAWPIKHSNIHKLLKEHKIPQRYAALKVRVLKTTSMYSFAVSVFFAGTLPEAKSYEKRAEYESMFTSTDGDRPYRVGKRHRKKPRRYQTSSSEEDSADCSSQTSESLFNFDNFHNGRATCRYVFATDICYNFQHGVAREVNR